MRFEIVGKLGLAKDTDKRKCFEELRYKKGDKNKQGIARKDDFTMRTLRLTLKSNEDFFNVEVKGNLMGTEDSAVIKSMRKTSDNKYETFEFKYRDRDKYIGELAEFKKCVFVDGDSRHEFVNEYDYSMFIHSLLSKEENQNKLYKVVGDIEYSEYTNPKTNETNTYANYEVNRIYVVKEDTLQTATANVDMLINENAIDDTELEETGVFKISGYVTQYLNKDQKNKGYFQILEYPLHEEDEKKRKFKFELIKKLLEVNDCELAKIGFKINLINRMQEVEFDESMLSDEDKMYIAAEIMTLDDFKKEYGNGKGGYIKKFEIDKISATYKGGAVPTEFTLEQILSNGKQEEPKTTGQNVELDLEGGLTDDDIDDMFA